MAVQDLLSSLSFSSGGGSDEKHEVVVFAGLCLWGRWPLMTDADDCVNCSLHTCSNYLSRASCTSGGALKATEGFQLLLGPRSCADGINIANGNKNLSPAFCSSSMKPLSKTFFESALRRGSLFVVNALSQPQLRVSTKWLEVELTGPFWLKLPSFKIFIGCETKHVFLFFQVALWGLKPTSNHSF